MTHSSRLSAVEAADFAVLLQPIPTLDGIVPVGICLLKDWNTVYMPML